MYTAQDYSALIGTPGFSEALLKNHFALYEGYVKNVNAFDEILANLEIVGGANGPDFNELKRRYCWEYNGMYLHELYFGNMKNGGTALDPASAFSASLEERFGSTDMWKKDFLAVGAMRGVGWTLLVRTAQGRLENIWLDEHDRGSLVGSVPLLVLDVFEHAFVVDYGLKRADYIDAFFNSLDWAVVAERFNN